ncbi:uncharacterized protein CTRU02_200766 [Colletotrichum truncatum]|uniref:Uncharacterized protein n=1 Tax=Colletotrichum truncatum TaxID=5467 RepID=A0ACC3ZFJ6_COLTU|nr:uncharacterized protein CTRU02_00533 [Colletotrichum truncatum]KAF6801784.1 hypothetical protein CTRU02_00533 [Colletotrichum truncatum]
MLQHSLVPRPLVTSLGRRSRRPPFRRNPPARPPFPTASRCRRGQEKNALSATPSEVHFLEGV